MLAAIAMWDAQILLFIQEYLRTAFGDVLMVVWSRLGNAGLIWIVAGLLLLCFRKTRKAGALALGGMLLNLLVVNGCIKHLVGRTRPWLVVEGLETLLRSSDPNSFPSGHTSASFAFAAAMVLNLDVGWAKVLTVTAAALMGFSRLYVGVHFPTDVLAGAAIGALCGVLATWFYRRYLQKRFPI